MARSRTPLSAQLEAAHVAYQALEQKYTALQAEHAALQATRPALRPGQRYAYAPSQATLDAHAEFKRRAAAARELAMRTGKSVVLSRDA